MTLSRTDVPTVPFAAVRATVPMSDLASFYDAAYRQVADAAQREGWTLSGPAIGWYRGMPTDVVDLAAGFPVEDAAVGATSGEVQVTELPGGAALTLTHTGGYDGLPGAWDRLEQHRAAHGLQVRGDFWEEYVTEPAPDGDPSANVTRLVLPLAPG